MTAPARSTPRRERREAARGFATRSGERRGRMAARLARAATAGEQAQAAWDWFRSEIRHSAAPPAERAARLRRVAEFIHAETRDLIGGHRQ